MPNRTRVPEVVLAGALLLAACGGGPAKGTALSDATGPTSTVAGSTPSTSLVTTAVTTPTTTAPTASTPDAPAYTAAMAGSNSTAWTKSMWPLRRASTPPPPLKSVAPLTAPPTPVPAATRGRAPRPAARDSAYTPASR